MWSKTWELAIGLGYILEFREAPSFVDKPMRRERGGGGGRNGGRDGKRERFNFG